MAFNTNFERISALHANFSSDSHDKFRRTLTNVSLY